VDLTYTKNIREFIKVELEKNPNDSAIARKVLRSFDDLDKDPASLARSICNYRKKTKLKAGNKPIKRLFFDIETSYIVARTWRIGETRLNHNQIVKDKKIICISYKWQHEERVHTLTWDKNQNEREMLSKFITVLGEADEVAGHNSDSFDIRELRTRCIDNGILMYPTYRSIDTLKKARQYFRFSSNKLDYLGEFLNVGRKLSHEGFSLWVKVVEENNKKALKRMVEYCERDVILLEDVYMLIAPYVTHNTNFSVIKGGELWHCPECTSKDVSMYKTYATPKGVIQRNMKCHDCQKQYRISNKTYQSMLSSPDSFNVKARVY